MSLWTYKVVKVEINCLYLQFVLHNLMSCSSEHLSSISFLVLKSYIAEGPFEQQTLLLHRPGQVRGCHRRSGSRSLSRGSEDTRRRIHGGRGGSQLPPDFFLPLGFQPPHFLLNWHSSPRRKWRQSPGPWTES